MPVFYKQKKGSIFACTFQACCVLSISTSYISCSKSSKEKKQFFAMSYTGGFHSLSETQQDIDLLCLVFLCFDSFCVTCSVFKLSPDLKYYNNKGQIVVQQLPFYFFDEYRLQAALWSRYQLRLISPPGNLFITVLRPVQPNHSGLVHTVACLSIYLYCTPFCNNHMLRNTKREK